MIMPLDYDIASSPPPFMLNFDYGEFIQEFASVYMEDLFHVNFVMCDPSATFSHSICTIYTDLFTPLTYFSNDGLHWILVDLEQIDFSIENSPIFLDYFPSDESLVNFLGGYSHLPSYYKDIYPSFLNMEVYFGQYSSNFDTYNSQYEEYELNFLPIPSQLYYTSHMLIDETIEVDIGEDPNKPHIVLLGKVLKKE